MFIGCHLYIIHLLMESETMLQFSELPTHKLAAGFFSSQLQCFWTTN